MLIRTIPSAHMSECCGQYSGRLTPSYRDSKYPRDVRTSDGMKMSSLTRAHIWFTSNAELGGRFFVGRHAKICNTSGSIPSKEDVFRFQIPVIHSFLMTCLDTIQYLEEYLSDDLIVEREVVIIQCSPQVSPGANIEH